MASLTVADVASLPFLRQVWKSEIRPVLRSLTFRDSNLAPDPLAYVGYEWGLDLLLKRLANDLLAGTYVAEKAEVVRAAKNLGLSRPLAFLTVRDAIVYRSITLLVRADLTRGAREYVAFLRSEKGGRPDITEINVDSFDWFMFWLQREWRISEWVGDESVTHIVESDIANFYPSVRLEAVREHLHSITPLSKEVVRLCLQLIDGVMPRTDYSETSMLGLPQEIIGASREVAHSLLLHVDEEFASEGDNGYYTRFMDDIAIGVSSFNAGEKCIARLQRSLEVLGLYPNSSKTRIVSIQQFLAEHLVNVNGELEQIDLSLDTLIGKKPGEIDLPENQRKRIEALSAEFRSQLPRPRRWDRVMRRIYTLHRRLALEDWSPYWKADLLEHPGSAAQILEYVRSWPLTLNTLSELIDISRTMGSLYPDLSVLCADTISLAPSNNNEAEWQAYFNKCLAEARRLIKSVGASLYQRAAASWAVAAYKFGNDDQRAALVNLLRVDDPQSPVREQGLSFHVGLGLGVDKWLSTEPGMTAGSALNAEYLRSLQQGNSRAIGVALNVLTPQARLAPLRFCVNPRALPLLEPSGTPETPDCKR